MMLRRLLPAAALCLLGVQPALANERHFTQSYETATLAPGVVELEPWATARLGRDGYYTGIDNRLEFEVGLTDRLQTSMYVNWGVEGVRNPLTKGIDTTANHRGVSSEWKLRLSDSVADPVGSALYLEFTLGPEEVEIEGKVLVDKRSGPWNVAVNGIYEFEHNYAESIEEHKLQATAAVGYFLADHLSVGLEAMDFNVVEPQVPGGSATLLHGAIYAGPVLSYGLGNWWVAASVTPQFYGYGKAVLPGRGLDLQDFERVQARVLMGVHL